MLQPQPPQPPAPARRRHPPPPLHAISSTSTPVPPAAPAFSRPFPPKLSHSQPPSPQQPLHPPQPDSLQNRRQTFPLITPPSPPPPSLPLPPSISNLWAQQQQQPPPSPPLPPRGVQPLRIFAKGVNPSPTAAREATLSFLRHLYDVAVEGAGGGGGICALANVVDLRSCARGFVADVLRLWIAVDAFLDGRNFSNEKWAVGVLRDVESVLDVIGEEEEVEEEEEEGGGGCVMDVAEMTEDEMEKRWEKDGLFPLWNEVFDAWNDSGSLCTEVF